VLLHCHADEDASRYDEPDWLLKPGVITRVRFFFAFFGILIGILRQ